MSDTKPHRRALTPLQKRGVYSNYECRCANFSTCGHIFRGVKSVFCFDHTHALCLGGGNEDENFRPLCRDCTMAKNAADARALKKAGDMEAARLAVSPTIARLKQDRSDLLPKSGRTIRNRSGFQNRPSSSGFGHKNFAASRGREGDLTCV